VGTTDIAAAVSSRANYWTAVVLFAAGGAIAAMAGFDIVFDALTRGLAWLRILAYTLLLAAGLYFARHARLSLIPHKLSHPVTTPIAIALTVAVAIVVIDAVIFRAILPHSYVASFAATGVGKRLVYYMLRAFNEEVFYRLFLMSALVCGLDLARRSSAATPDRVYWIAIIAAQTAPVVLNAGPAYASEASPGFLLYALLRFIGPGILWGYLYWRHGFLTAQAAHVGTHVFLQPSLGHVL
jgi:hypothetical protein